MIVMCPIQYWLHVCSCIIYRVPVASTDDTVYRLQCPWPSELHDANTREMVSAN